MNLLKCQKCKGIVRWESFHSVGVHPYCVSGPHLWFTQIILNAWDTWQMPAALLHKCSSFVLTADKMPHKPCRLPRAIQIRFTDTNTVANSNGAHNSHRRCQMCVTHYHKHNGLINLRWKPVWTGTHLKRVWGGINISQAIQNNCEYFK